MTEFDDGLAAGRLVVGVCDACMRAGDGDGGVIGAPAYRAWPPGAGACPHCLGPIRWEHLPPRGRIVEFSLDADGVPFCLAEFAYGIRLLGVLLGPRGGRGGDRGSGAAHAMDAGTCGPSRPSGAASFVPHVSQRVVLESCSLGADGRPRYVMRAAGGDVRGGDCDTADTHGRPADFKEPA